MPDDRLPQRTLTTTFWVAALFTFVFLLRGDTTIAFGLAIGGAIGLMSLWSLTFAVPRLFTPGNFTAKFWMGLFTFFKLPLYAIVLNFAMTSKLVSPFAVFAGVAFVPVVLVLKVLGFQLVQKTPVPAEE